MREKVIWYEDLLYTPAEYLQYSASNKVLKIRMYEGENVYVVPESLYLTLKGMSNELVEIDKLLKAGGVIG